MRHALALVALSAPCSVASAQSVLVVDAAGGAGSTHTQVSAAVAAAASGDLIVVRAGSYGSFAVSGKSLSIQAEPGAQVTIETSPGSFGQIAVRNLAADQRVDVRGFDVPLGSEGLLLRPAFLVEDCAGAVVAEDCRFRASFIGHPAGGNGEGAKVLGSASVSFVRCTIEGLPSGAPPTFFSDGLGVCGSDVQLYDCQVSGIYAVTLVGGSLFASGGTLFGERSAVRVGTPGVFLCSGAAPHAATFLDAELVFHAGFPDVEVSAGTASVLPGASRTYGVSSPVREGEVAFEAYAGEPGDFAVLVVALTLEPAVPFFEFSGFAHVGPAALVIGRGIVGPGGVLFVPVVIPELDPGMAGISLYEQAVMIGVGGEIVLTDGVALQLLGEGV